MLKPILFRDTMVRAILHGEKTQTRRIIKPQPENADYWTYHSECFNNLDGAFYPNTDNAKPKLLKCPYGGVKDFLWVREGLKRFRRLEFLEQKFPEEEESFGIFDKEQEGMKWTAQYTATNTPVPYKHGAKEGWCGTALWQWKNKSLSNVFMPRWANRITLEIVNVRVEQLQSITDEDAMAEGIERWYYDVQYDENSFSYWSPVHGSGAASKFSEMWNSINAKRGYSWESNPWLWVIEFKVFEKK
jgi:hypothetical protein